MVELNNEAIDMINEVRDAAKADGLNIDKVVYDGPETGSINPLVYVGAGILLDITARKVLIPGVKWIGRKVKRAFKRRKFSDIPNVKRETEEEVEDAEFEEFNEEETEN